MCGVIGFSPWYRVLPYLNCGFGLVYGTWYSFVWTLLEFSMVLSMEIKNLCMVCMDGYGLV